MQKHPNTMIFDQFDQRTVSNENSLKNSRKLRSGLSNMNDVDRSLKTQDMHSASNLLVLVKNSFTSIQRLESVVCIQSMQHSSSSLCSLTGKDIIAWIANKMKTTPEGRVCKLWKSKTCSRNNGQMLLTTSSHSFLCLLLSVLFQSLMPLAPC